MHIGYRKDSKVYLKDMPAPASPGPGQIKVRVHACGVCGTDLQDNPADAGQERLMTGHEVAGVILEVGPHCPGLQPGQRLVLDSATPCGRCAACRNARQELCTDIQSFFFLNSFGFAEQMLAPAICAIPCEDLAPAVACLQEPLGVALDLVRLAEITPGCTALVLGAGPIGLMALALARRAGAARVFVSETARRPARCALALKWGAEAVVEPAEVTAFNYGQPLERLLVTAPPRALPDAFALAAKGAIISFIGIEHGKGAFCTFDANAFHFKKLQLRASFASPAQFGPTALDCLRRRVVDGEALISHRFPLARLAEAIDTARGPNALKVVIEP